MGQMSVEAAKQGYDSIQFLMHPDPQWRCNWFNTQKGVMNIEIVAPNILGQGACSKIPDQIRAGWNADKPCDCDPNQGFLNCKGYGRDATEKPESQRLFLG